MNSENQRNNFSTLDGIILSNFTTYAKLDPMIIQAFSGCPNATEVNVFIDLYPIVKSCYKYTGDIVDQTSLASNVISMCIHYREFFRRKGVYAHFYLINSINCSEEYSIAVPGYNDSMIQLINGRNNEKFILSNLTILKDICPYLPNIYFLSSPCYETSVLIAAIISKNINMYGTNALPNLIISKDLYPVELVTEFPNTAILIPKKVKENGTLVDDSIIANNEPFSFWEWFKARRQIKFNDTILLAPFYYSIINALTRFPERNVKSLYSLTKTLKAFNLLITEGLITNAQSPSFEYLQLVLEKTFPNINIATVKLRYNALSAIHGALQTYMNSPEFQFALFENKYDANILKNYNSLLFSKNPIELDKL